LIEVKLKYSFVTYSLT